MIKHCCSVLILLLLVIISNSCDNTMPVDSSRFEISGEPIVIENNVNSDSLQIERSPNYSIDYSALELNGAELTTVKYYYPNPNTEVDREFVVATNDSFRVEIKNCKNEYDWLIDSGTIEFGNNYWINSEVALLRNEKIINTDNTVNNSFKFKTLKEGKGYICFIERDSLGEVSSSESHGLLIGYSTNALNKISLNVSEIKWIYNTEEGTFSTVSVKIKGITNVYRLRGVTYGDGVIMAKEIPIHNNNSFEIELPITFSHREGVTLKTSSELLLYGTVGLPKIIKLINPKS